MRAVPGPGLAAGCRRARTAWSDPLTFLTDLAHRYGALVALPVPGPPVLLVTSAEHIDRVLRTGAARWTKQTRQYAALAAVTGPGLLAAHDEGWRDRRRAAQPPFQHDRLPDIAAATGRAVRFHVSRVLSVPGAPSSIAFDAQAFARAVALDALLPVLVPDHLAPHARGLVDAADRAARLVVAVGRLPLPEWLPTPARRALRHTTADLDRRCADLVAAGRRHPDPGEPHLLGVLLRAGRSDRQVRDELVTMVLAGHDTVASALSWTLMLLAEHPQYQRHEAAAVVGEALRLFPPAWVLSRRATAPDTLGGYAIPAGTTAIVSPWVTHRRGDLWPQPEVFDPSRFGADGLARPGRGPGRAGSGRARSGHEGRGPDGPGPDRPGPDGPGPDWPGRAAYLPFGLGPRLCLGRDLALTQLTAAVTAVLEAGHLSLPPGFTRPEPEPYVTLRPRGGMPLLLTPRDRAPR